MPAWRAASRLAVRGASSLVSGQFCEQRLMFGLDGLQQADGLGDFLWARGAIEMRRYNSSINLASSACSLTSLAMALLGSLMALSTVDQ